MFNMFLISCKMYEKDSVKVTFTASSFEFYTDSNVSGAFFLHSIFLYKHVT